MATKKASTKPKKTIVRQPKEPIKEKDKKINNEIRRLTGIFKDIEKNKRLTSKGLIEEAAYMKATLVELKASIDENGPIDEMQQGEYTYTEYSMHQTE